MSNEAEEAGLAAYLEELRRIPLLSREEEHELAVRAAAGDEKAREALVRANLRFVVALAVQHQRKGLRLADLIAEGNVGLMIAARKFDPNRGTRFVSYAGHWIRACILDFIVRQAAMIGAGSGPMRSKLFFRLRRERARLAQEGIEESESLKVIAERMGMSEEKTNRMLEHLDLRIVSLDAPLNPESEATLAELLPTPEDLESRVESKELSAIVSQRLEEALGLLDPRERLIVEKRYLEEEELSLADLGRMLGVSRERARQLEARARSKLRRALEDLAPLCAAA